MTFKDPPNPFSISMTFKGSPNPFYGSMNFHDPPNPTLPCLCDLQGPSQPLLWLCDLSGPFQPISLLPFQVVSSRPYTGDGRGAAALRLLHALCCSVHPALEQLWSKRVPLLVERIEGRRGFLWGGTGGCLTPFGARGAQKRFFLENTEKSLHPEEWEEELLLVGASTLLEVGG